MNVKYITLNPGSLLLQKDYTWIKKAWYKLRNKELPYNYFTLFGDECAVIDIYGKHSKTLVVEPKKAYSKKEIKALDTLIKTNTDFDWADWFSSFEGKTRDLFTIINAIRPGTFSDNETNLEALLNSKFYNVKRLSDEQNWSEYIF